MPEMGLTLGAAGVVEAAIAGVVDGAAVREVSLSVLEHPAAASRTAAAAGAITARCLRVRLDKPVPL
jgi:hypothetical protein